MELIIRQATTHDSRTVADFNNRLAEETESISLAPDLICPGVVALLTNSNRGSYWLAEVDARPIAQIGVTYEWSDWRNGMWWWIQSVYVEPAHRRKGVLSRLYKHVESLARDDEESCGLRLYVREDNASARDTYRSHGMRSTGYLVMESFFDGSGEETC